MKILSIVGARPQFVKAFMISNVLRKQHNEVLVHTGQHYDEFMSDVFFEELGIPEPDVNLGVGSGSHGQQTAEMLSGVETLLEEENPDIVLLYGDTNSTIAGALAGSKMDPAVAHVEAGLRSHEREMPEEVNRILTDHASDYLYAPSDLAMTNLREEGLEERAVNVGDVMYDALVWAKDQARQHATILDDLELEAGDFILATVHRAKNTNDPERLRSIFDALGDSPLPIVVPIHPRTENCLKEYGLWETATADMEFIEPVGYLDFVRLLDAADRVATDSGGVQKEGFFLDTYCVTLRDETEWVETVEAGWNTLVGVDRNQIVEELERDWSPPADKPTPYGDGDAASRIRDHLETVL